MKRGLGKGVEDLKRSKEIDRVWRVWRFRWSDERETFNQMKLVRRWIRRRSETGWRKSSHHQGHGGGGAEVLHEVAGGATDLGQKRTIITVHLGVRA